MVDIIHTARLADGVHAELRVAEVEGAHAHFGGQHGPDGGAARGVVADDKELQRHLGELGDFLDQRYADRVGDISLVGVDCCGLF